MRGAGQRQLATAGYAAWADARKRECDFARAHLMPTAIVSATVIITGIMRPDFKGQRRSHSRRNVSWCNTRFLPVWRSVA